jgi:glyoxylase-like metal-dependent hydrolase (beta-lactamase superfamily II)
MHRTFSSSIVLLAVIAFATSAAAQVAEAPSPVNATYVAPSATTVLAPDAKIGQLFTLSSTRPYILQRLTKRTYWFSSGHYATTFYVGSRGVLLFDPLEGHGAQILQAIAEVTKLPVTAVVYSHDHADHIADAAIIRDASAKAGVAKLRIIASKQTAEKMRALASKHPAPTETVAWPAGSFRFEGLTVALHGFRRAAHSDDAAAWLLGSEKVLHLPDLVNPDQPPFWQFAGSENYVYYRTNLAAIAALDWTYLNGGHGNVGSKRDLAFYGVFLDDLEAAVGKAMASTPFGEGVDAKKINAHTAFLATWVDAVARKATDALRAKYGALYGFEYSVPANARMVAMTLFEYR